MAKSKPGGSFDFQKRLARFEKKIRAYTRRHIHKKDSEPGRSARLRFLVDQYLALAQVFLEAAELLANSVIKGKKKKRA
jgi:hypothetical protein